MAKVEVGLRPVVGHVDFAVLIGRHRPRIDVQIGVELADTDLVAARLKKRPERGRQETRSEEHTSELQSPCNLVCRLLLEKKKKNKLKATGDIEKCSD